MTATGTELPPTRTFSRGVHPPEGKHFAEEAAIEVLPAPQTVAVPMQQHLGKPAEAIVKMKQEVAAGEMIGKATGFISAAVHTPIAGTVAKASVATLPNARHVQTIPIKAGGEGLDGQALFDDVLGGHWPTDSIRSIPPKQIVEAVAEAGIVGQGGAAFPTHVKLSVSEEKPIDTILVNGCECEPYLTADYRLMLEAPRPVLVGAMLAARAVGAARVVVAIEDNKPAAIERMQAEADALRGGEAAGVAVTIRTMKTKYPMGGEKQTIISAVRRTVPTGGLPLDVGVVVVNVGTASAVARAVLRGKALTHRIMSVTGAGIAQPKNILAPVGVSYQALIDFCGGLKPEAARVISGGPMMGMALGDLSAPVTKGTSGVTVLTARDVARQDEAACVRCGRCVDVCPLNLVPTRIGLSARASDWDVARRYHMMACMECGCCAYACPSAIPLVQLIRSGKARMPRD